MKGVGAARTRETYLAVLRPWFGFLTKHGYQWNARPEAVREYTRLFLLEAGCALRTGAVEGWFVQATNRSPISTNGLHLVIAALRSFYSVMRRGVFDSEDQRLHPLYPFENPMYSRVLLAWRFATLERRTTPVSVRDRASTRPASPSASSRSNASH